MCNGKCGGCNHEPVWHNDRDKVDAEVSRWAGFSSPVWDTSPRPELVKKTTYPRSFSLTNAQYRMAMAGRFNGVVVVDSRTGARLFDENEFGLADVLKTAVPKTTRDGVIYWVVRF